MIKVLELFAGSRSIGRAFEKLNCFVYSVDIEQFKNINLCIDIMDFKPEKLHFTPCIIWASPPCTYFSVASIGKHWNKNNTPKTKEAIKGYNIAVKTKQIIDYFLKINPNLIYYIENPRGKLRKLNIYNYDRCTVWYCKYGDIRAKPTDIFSNNIYNPLFNIDGWKPKKECFNGNKKCHHEKAPRGSKTGTQGLKNNYIRSKIPAKLCEEIATETIKKINFIKNTKKIN